MLIKTTLAEFPLLQFLKAQVSRLKYKNLKTKSLSQSNCRSKSISQSKSNVLLRAKQTVQSFNLFIPR